MSFESLIFGIVFLLSTTGDLVLWMIWFSQIEDLLTDINVYVVSVLDVKFFQM